MKQYKCHKVVVAGKITDLRSPGSYEFLVGIADQETPVSLTEAEFVRVGGAREKAEDEDLGYLVIYEDGYKSWSPSKAFEDGYSLLVPVHRTPDSSENGQPA